MQWGRSVRNDHRPIAVCVSPRQVDIVGGTSTKADGTDQQRPDIDAGEDYVSDVGRMQKPDKPSPHTDSSREDRRSRGSRASVDPRAVEAQLARSLREGSQRVRSYRGNVHRLVVSLSPRNSTRRFFMINIRRGPRGRVERARM